MEGLHRERIRRTRTRALGDEEQPLLDYWDHLQRDNNKGSPYPSVIRHLSIRLSTPSTTTEEQKVK